MKAKIYVRRKAPPTNSARPALIINTCASTTKVTCSIKSISCRWGNMIQPTLDKPYYNQYAEYVITHLSCDCCGGTGKIHSHNPICPDCHGCGRRTVRKHEKDYPKKWANPFYLTVWLGRYCWQYSTITMTATTSGQDYFVQVWRHAICGNCRLIQIV